MARIIYVEDDEIVGEFVCEILTRAGHWVEVVGHGTLAFETIAFKKPDLVILVPSLPGMQGIEILKLLRQMPSMYLTPILMMIGRRGDPLAKEAMAAGADDYMIKSLQTEYLVERVAAALENKHISTNRNIH